MPKKIISSDPKSGPTAGYPEIEHLIDTEDFSTLNEKFNEAYEALQAIAGHKRGLKGSRDAKKSMKVLELVMDLLRELLTIKYRLQEIAGQARPSSKA